MAEPQMTDDNEIDYDEVDMGDQGIVGEIDDHSKIDAFINAVQNKEYTDAETQFNDLIGDRLQQKLDQAKIDIANRIYNAEESIDEPEDEDVED